MRSNVYANSVRDLTQLGPLRVWSLLVTVFGDLSQSGAVDGPVLTAIMAEAGIKPEATRVALHRLRSDGWITSHRSGRTSRYSLTAKGQSDSAAARPRIYGTPENMGRGMQVFVTAENGNSLDPADYAQIVPRVFVAGEGTVCPAGAMALQPVDIPRWLGPQVESKLMFDGYVALHGVLAEMDCALRNGNDLTALQVAVLRVLIVHAWRRLALKHPDLPSGAHSSGWRGHDCRALVASLLNQLDRPAHDTIKAP